MNDKQRKAAKEEALHELLKNRAHGIGPVDAEDIAASAVVLKKQMAEKGIATTSPKELIEMQRALLSDSGADPTMAEQQIKAKIERDKSRGKRKR